MHSVFSYMFIVWYNREAILRCSEAAGYQLGRRKKVQFAMFDSFLDCCSFPIASCGEVTAVILCLFL